MIYAIVSLHSDYTEKIRNTLSPYRSSVNNNNVIKSIYESDEYPYISFVVYGGSPQELRNLLGFENVRYMIIGLEKFTGFVDSGLHSWVSNNG